MLFAQQLALLVPKEILFCDALKSCPLDVSPIKIQICKLFIGTSQKCSLTKMHPNLSLNSQLISANIVIHGLC